MNTQINYTYQDADNHKIPQCAIIDGILTAEQKEQIKECLFWDDEFIPAKVGLPEIKFGSTTYADVDVFEFDGFEDVEDEPTVFLTPDNLTNNFILRKDRWFDEGLKSIMHGGTVISPENIIRAEQVLTDNGIPADEASTVLQALGYVLLNLELYPDA